LAFEPVLPSVDHTEGMMVKARVGDRLAIKGHRIHEPDRDAEILEVGDPDGGPPYRIRWSDSDRVTLLFPGSDARIEPVEHDHGSLPPGLLGQPARDPAGDPVLHVGETVGLLRRHIDLERLRTTDHDTELWALWRQEVARADSGTSNAAILDRVLSHVREGG
jgi:hypothetical protein